MGGGEIRAAPGLAAEFVRLNVDVMLTGSTPGALAAKEATQAIPVVIWSMGDAVGRG